MDKLKLLLLITISIFITNNLFGDTNIKAQISVYIAAGQSNMVGFGIVKELPVGIIGPHTEIPAISNYLPEWAFLKAGMSWNKSIFGPQLTFGLDMADFETSISKDRKIAIIKYAVGGTALYSRWRPPTAGGKTGDLYLGLIEFVNDAMAKLNQQYEAKIEGMLWMQGESDTYSEKIANDYELTLTCFIRDLRFEFEAPKMPFVIGEISSHETNYRFQPVVIQAQKNVATKVPYCRSFTTSELERRDYWHYGTDGVAAIGTRFANEMQLVKFGHKIVYPEFDLDIEVNRTGTFYDVKKSDNVYEKLKEIISTNEFNESYSHLESKWSTYISATQNAVFNIEAHHSPNSENDDFIFSYSLDDINYTNMLTISKTIDDNNFQTYKLPNGFEGFIYIKVEDTDNSPNNLQLDDLYIDNMYIYSEKGSATTLKIVKQSKELIECEGSEEASIFVAGKANMGVTPKYRWYKDGIVLPNETNPKLEFLKFDFNVSGSYQCEISTPGVVKNLWSDIIPVYVLTEPNIIEQPKSVSNAILGNGYTFIVKSHYHGIAPPLFDDKFQWYYYDADKAQDIPLGNNSNFAGCNSNILTIQSLSLDNICKNGDYYYVKIEGQCGIIKSETFIISQKPEVVIAKNPNNLEVCPSENIEFSIKANVTNNLALEYQWKKNGVDIIDNAKFNGVNSTTLQIVDVEKSDEGNYSCSVQIVGQTDELLSDNASLTVFDLPSAYAIGGTEIEITRKNDLTLIVDLLAGKRPIHVKWNFKDKIIKEGLLDEQNDAEQYLTIFVEDIEKEQTGEYICTLTNDCGIEVIVFNVKVNIWDNVNSINDKFDKGYDLFMPIPNPVSDILIINFEIPKSEIVNITIYDINGNLISEVFNSFAKSGMNTISIYSDKLVLPTGTYIYTMEAGNYSASQSFVIVK